MKQLILLGILAFLLHSCDMVTGTSKTTTSEKKVYDLYEPSEMANYMNAIYDLNESLKKDIKAGKIPAEFPEEILNIHSAEMSGNKSHNATFKNFSHLFVERVQILYDTTTTVPLEERYNDVINLCLSCHQSQCPGPLPRIRKLLITQE
ncbi:MAG TPA: hypothetical protein VFD80_01350 [Flavobacteriaceae bacterium]|nr:hypothetical protein [Flavobacteriaceae bacterium]